MAMKRRAQKDGGLAISPPCAPPPPALCHPAPRTKPADDLQRCGDLPTGHPLDGKASHHAAIASQRDRSDSLFDTSSSSDESVPPAPVTCSRKKPYRIKPDSESDGSDRSESEWSGDRLCEYFDNAKPPAKPRAKRLPSKNFCCYSIFYESDDDCVEHPDPSDGEMIPCSGGRCPYKFHFHKKCCRRWEQLQTETDPNLDVDEIEQYFCPCCHPWERRRRRRGDLRAAIEEKAFGRRSDGDRKPAAKKTKRSPPRKQKSKQPKKRKKQSPPSSTGTPSDPSGDSLNKVNDFICHLADGNGETNEKNRGPDERFDDVCDAFAKKIVHHQEGTLKAATKIEWLRLACRPELSSLLSGGLLKLAKEQQCFSRLKEHLRVKAPAVVKLSVPAMQLGRLIHEQQCQDDCCLHCDNRRRDMPIPANNNSRWVMEMYEAASEVVINRDRTDSEKRARGLKSRSKSIRSYPDSMFTVQGFPRNYRYSEKMVSSFLFSFSVSSS